MLDYNSASPATPRLSTWIGATLCGAIIGAVIATYAFQPMLRVLSQGTQLAVFEIDEPFRMQSRFVGFVALSGVAVAVAALVMKRRLLGSNLAVWLLAFTTVFAVGSGIGLCYARYSWRPMSAPRVVGGLVRLTEAPSLIVPVFGLLLVVVVCVGLLVRLANRPAA